jgi:hypothetical protein
MIEVVALVCSMQAPLRCKDLNLTFVGENVTLQQCMMYGQMELAKWTSEHPGWHIVRGFKCGRAGRYARI